MVNEPRRRSSLLPRLSISRTNRPARYVQKSNRPRWVLHLQAVFWRTLMELGMFFHRLAPPQPPKPNFLRTMQTSISGKPGQVNLYFYVPSNYETQKRLGKADNEGPNDENDEDDSDDDVGESRDRSRLRMSLSSISDGLRRRSRRERKWGGYPVVINFHGGGFTLGSPHDDGRWCGTVVQEVNAVVITVEYRLAPEYSFPTAVEDGADAVVWVHQHAEELGIDPNKIVLSGFSSGGNMAITVPLLLHDLQTGFPRNESLLDLSQPEGDASHPGGDVVYTPPGTASTDTTVVAAGSSTTRLISDSEPPTARDVHPRKADTSFSERDVHPPPQIRIKCIVPWYPSLDYTRTREERRATCVRIDQELPAFFTDLFDDSYLHPPKDLPLNSPYLSPGVAPTDLLRAALPTEIILHTCEWDMLFDEGEAFHRRLIADEIGKTVHYTMIPGVPHGWDKAPNPWRPTPGVREYYVNACNEMRRILGEAVSPAEPPPRKSLVR